MKRSPLRRKTPLNRGTARLKCTRLKSRSPKKAQDDRKYTKAKAEHFAEHPGCQFPGCTLSLLNGDLIDLHHCAGRNGPLLYTKRWFKSACRPHHDWVKANQSKARAIGWIVDVSSDEVRRLKTAELFEP